MSIFALSSINPDNYVQHALHGAEQAWAETNCYIDVWIEVLHTLGLEPRACLPMVFANDFDGDQWTFYKPPHEDLFALYGINVQELNVWRSLLENSSEQLRRGRLVLTETDSFYLPDTVGTDYRTNHIKTTIAIQEIDVNNRRLGYFHNSSYHVLNGDDFIQTIRLGMPHDPSFMPMFAEFVRLDRLQKRDEKSLADISLSLLKKHFSRRPVNNPVSLYKQVFLSDVAQLKEQGLAAYHAYAFANLRQLGAGYSLGASYLRWLERNNQGNFSAAAADFELISDTTKTLLLKTARAVMSNKEVDLDSLLSTLEDAWASGMQHLLLALAE